MFAVNFLRACDINLACKPTWEAPISPSISALMKLGADSVDHTIEAISTGSIGLDAALGIGGLPKGRVVEIYGPESSGKTTLALQVVAECQKGGGTAAFIDAEHALDPIYAGKIGCLLYTSPSPRDRG